MSIRSPTGLAEARGRLAALSRAEQSLSIARRQGWDVTSILEKIGPLLLPGHEEGLADAARVLIRAAKAAVQEDIFRYTQHVEDYPGARPPTLRTLVEAGERLKWARVDGNAADVAEALRFVEDTRSALLRSGYPRHAVDYTYRTYVPLYSEGS